MPNILVVGPHPDDQELGMGGAIAKFIAQGHNVLLLDMTTGEPTPHGSPSTRQKEAATAARILGLKLPRKQLRLPNRKLQHTLAARHAVAAVIRKHQASIVFLPYFEDAHPDHLATTRIVEDARFDAKLTRSNIPGKPIYPTWLFYYYCTHLRHVAQPSFCIDVSDHIQTKQQAILAYKSQFVTPVKNQKIVHWLKNMNAYLGSRIGAAYAEPFFSREPIALSSLDSLLL